MYKPAKFPRIDDGSGIGYGGDKGGSCGGEKGEGGKGGFHGDEIAFKLLATPPAAGKIIGRGGSEVSTLRKQCGVNCHITGPESIFPGTGCQVVVLSGPRAGVDMAFGYIIHKLAEAEPVDPSHGPQLMTVMAVLTSNAVSAVIGSKGSTIASLRRETGCSISADKDNINGEQVLRISGGVESVLYALSMVTPLVERAGDSMQFAKQEYGKGGPEEGVWGSGYGPKGGGKRKGKWEEPAWPGVIGKGHAGGGGPKGYPTEPRRQKSTGPPPWASAGGGGAIGAGAVIGAASAPPGYDQVKAEPSDGTSTKDLAAVLGLDFAEGVDASPDGAEAEGESDGLPARGDNGFVAMAPEDPAVMGSTTGIQFSIPREAIGRVLGKGGESSAEIRRETGVSLKITPHEAEGIVYVSGVLQAVHRAHCMVVARVLAEY